MRLRNVKHNKTILSKTLGLMFHRWTDHPYVFYFNKEKRIDLHTFFCFYPLHLYFLDKKKKVVEIKLMRPFRIYISKNKAKYVVESMNDLDILVGDKVNF